MRQGQRRAIEREYGRPLSIDELVRRDPSLRWLAEQAKAKARMRRRHDLREAVERGLIASIVALAWIAVLYALICGR